MPIWPIGRCSRKDAWPSPTCLSTIGARAPASADATSQRAATATGLGLRLACDFRVPGRGARAEALPFGTASADIVTIAFGLRNVTDRDAAIAEAHRILRPGGRFLCLEFSQVSNAALARVYDSWSFNVLPRLGQLVAGDADSYRYLVESIRTFPSPEILADMFAGAGFAQVRVRRLSGGIACIHSGWKLD